ncbi:hypothetical protein FHQ27_12080 [Testudinibacter sp. TR-2022]|nr:hypothetical protein FHQ30_08560 [Pasteurellaceae bacterium Phil11]TNH22893.1 hypothetical protein FHQ27_12080 [Testudinibacter sp. TR-2022]TNH23894.1 hypothetical protein FHQ29_04645 [Testudinibacter sp. TR-2022]
MTVKITGLSELKKATNALEKKVVNHQKTAIRRGLNAGAKELKNAIKPHVPVLASSTRFRKSGTLKKSVRHETTIARSGNSGKTKIFISDKNKTSSVISRKRNRRDAKGRLRTGPIKVYLNDPYYWYMVDRGTVNMRGRHFMKKGEDRASAALETVKRTVENEIKKVIK